jgi:hypothetical protein
VITRARPLKPAGRRRSGGGPESAWTRDICGQEATSAATPWFRSAFVLILRMAKFSRF